jgi:hypothetical protein
MLCAVKTRELMNGLYANAGPRGSTIMWRTLSASRRGLHKGGERVKGLHPATHENGGASTDERSQRLPGLYKSSRIQRLLTTTKTPVGEVVYSFSTGRSTKTKSAPQAADADQRLSP